MTIIYDIHPMVTAWSKFKVLPFYDDPNADLHDPHLYQYYIAASTAVPSPSASNCTLNMTWVIVMPCELRCALTIWRNVGMKIYPKIKLGRTIVEQMGISSLSPGSIPALDNGTKL